MNRKSVLGLSILLSALTYGEEWGGVQLEASKIVSTTGFETSLKNVANNPVIVTAKDIEENNYQSVDEILQSIPSVNIINQGANKIVDLRGQGDDAKVNVQVMIDGVPVNSLDTSMTSTPINTIDVNVIERIEVIPGGGAVLYGSGTAGGVVNIITKSGQGFRGNAGYRFTQYGGHRYTAGVGHSIGKFDIALDYTKENDHRYRDYDKKDSDFFQGKVTYNIAEDENVSVKYSKFKSDETVPNLLTREQMDADKKQSGLNPGEESKLGVDKDEVTLTYNKKLQDNLDFSVSSFYQKTILSPFEKAVSVSPVMTSTTVQDAKFKDEKWGVKPKLRLAYGEGSSAVFGLDYIKNKMKRDVGIDVNVAMITGKTITQKVSTLNDIEKETISGFVYNTYKYNKFEFIQGARYERANYDIKRSSSSLYISGTKETDNFALELAANYLYSDTGNTYVKYERGFTSPPPALMTNKENGRYYMNDLKSETYDTFEWGVKDFVLDSYVRATAFYTITRDEMTSETSGSYSSANGTIINYNLDKTKRYGIELSAEQYFGKFTLSESYNFIKTRISGTRRNGVDYTGNEVANVPQNRFKLGGKYAYNKNFSAGFETIYAGSYYLNNANEGGKQNQHVVTNIVANYDFNNGLRVFAGINNLFNERYYDQVSYSTSTKEFTYDPAVGRNYYVGFNYNF